MQSCALMNGPSWQASSNRMRNVSTNNLWQYTAHSNWPSSLPGQDGRGYNGVLHDSQSGSQGHPREFYHNAAQNLSDWNRNIISCSQSDGLAQWKQTLRSWGQPAGVHSHDVVADALPHRTDFYQTMTQPRQQPKSNIATTSISVGRSLLSTNAHQRSQQHSPLTPVATNQMMYSTATGQSSISSADGRTQAPVNSLRTIPQRPSPQSHRPLQKHIPEIVQLLSQRHLDVAKHQDRSSSEVCLLATNECTGSGKGSTGSASGLTWHQEDVRSCDTSGQTDRNVPESHQEDAKQSERTLQCLPLKAWTLADLKTLVQETQQAQWNSESSAAFDLNLISSLWNNDLRILQNQLKSHWYKNLMSEISDFLQHWTADSVVLIQSKCNLNLSGLHVLQDGEKYFEPCYTSSWRNVNEKLDDIDKEFGFAMTYDGDFLNPLESRSGVSSNPNVSKAVEEEWQRVEQEEDQEVEQEEYEEERTSSVAVAHGSKDDSYSFIIQVHPQEEAKAIHESFQPAGDHPAKEHLKDDHPLKEHLEGSDMDQGDSSGDLKESEVEMFFAKWKEVVLGCSPVMKSQDDVSHRILEDKEVKLHGTSSADEGNPSNSLNQSEDTTPLQQDDQETGNTPQQRTEVESKDSHPKEMQRHWRTEQRSKSETFFAKRLAPARERKRTRHAPINVPLLKKLKNLKSRHDQGSTRRKDSAKDIHRTLPPRAPEVLNVSQRGMSAVKQRIYQEWSLPPTRIESRSKVRSQKRSFTERPNSEDKRKDHKVILKKWRPGPDHYTIREKAWWPRSKDGDVRKTAEGHSVKFQKPSKPETNLKRCSLSGRK
uniref:uncharacterized protein LOC131126364 n=1 Tax=Doryrhamphus excisus TaxID=161450 RepID=UPI0025AE3913|nr:uncharacterized protein LOC131126364 [Doryrhamphus excisus]